MFDTLRYNDTEKEYAILRLGEMSYLGDCRSQLSGNEIFVFGGIPGELVKARIYRYRRKKINVISAIVDEVIESSPHRISVKCPYFGPCSGCQWQHMDYELSIIHITEPTRPY